MCNVNNAVFQYNVQRKKISTQRRQVQVEVYIIKEQHYLQ